MIILFELKVHSDSILFFLSVSVLVRATLALGSWIVPRCVTSLEPALAGLAVIMHRINPKAPDIRSLFHFCSRCATAATLASATASTYRSHSLGTSSHLSSRSGASGLKDCWQVHSDGLGKALKLPFEARLAWFRPKILFFCGFLRDLRDVHICVYIYIYIYMYVYMYLSIHPSTYVSIYLFICLPIYLSIYVSIYLSIYLSIFYISSINLSACLSVCLFHHSNK